MIKQNYRLIIWNNGDRGYNYKNQWHRTHDPAFIWVNGPIYYCNHGNIYKVERRRRSSLKPIQASIRNSGVNKPIPWMISRLYDVSKSD